MLGRTNSKFDLDLCTISIVNYKEPVSEEWHSHEDIHLSLILQGGNLESRKIKDTQVSPGKIIVYDQGEIHRNRFTAFPSKNLNLELKGPFQNGKRHKSVKEANYSLSKNGQEMSRN